MGAPEQPQCRLLLHIGSQQHEDDEQRTAEASTMGLEARPAFPHPLSRGRAARAAFLGLLHLLLKEDGV
jgi:hypothetical protein